jgi:heme exporter protein B
VIALLTRDLTLAMRAGGGFGLGLAFFLIVVTLVPFGVGPQSELLARIAPGILWLGALLAIGRTAALTSWPPRPCRWRGSSP